MALSKVAVAGVVGAARGLGRRSREIHSTSAPWARILCLDGIDPVCVDIFRERGHKTDVKNKLTPDQLAGIVGDYDGMVVRSATKVTPHILAHAKNMKVIGRAGVGIDNIDVAEATRKGIMVMNTPGGNTVSTAQLAISLLCTAARRIAEADISMKEGKWERKKFMGVELSGKTLAIVGCGRIGQVVAKWAQGFNMKVVGFDPALSKDAAERMGIQLFDLHDIWGQADFITLHTPLTPDTKNLVNDSTIAKMRKGVIIVNCARGGIIDEAALLRGLESGHVASAALDVYSSEPPPESVKPLLAHPRMVCTPHLGASTEEAQINVARDVAVQMCDTLEGKDFVGVVNVSYMAMANEPAMKPFLELGEIIGRLHAQSIGTPGVSIRKITLHTYGGRSFNIEKPTARQVLLAQTLKGVLKHLPGVKTEPSLINAPFLAQEHGIESAIDQKVHPVLVNSPYSNVITVSVELDNGEKHSVSGSVFGSEPNIVQIDEYKSFPAFHPEGALLTFRNEDRPGAVSKVLEILEAANINVAKLNVGRQDGKLALCLIDLDTAPPAEVLQQLKALDTLHDVSVASLAG